MAKGAVTCAAKYDADTEQDNLFPMGAGYHTRKKQTKEPDML